MDCLDLNLRNVEDEATRKISFKEDKKIKVQYQAHEES